nr:hypothetical protein [uncultured Desulfuromonas sp.]
MNKKALKLFNLKEEDDEVKLKWILYTGGIFVTSGFSGVFLSTKFVEGLAKEKGVAMRQRLFQNVCPS